MDKALVEHYRNRWQSVAEVELQERQTTSLEQRWIQLNNVLRLATSLNVVVATDEMVVWQRWAKLKQAHS